MLRNVAAGFGLVLSLSAPAAPPAELWPRWAEHDPASRAAIDHSSWDGLLQKYLVEAEDGLNRFDYAAVSPADKRILELYLIGLQRKTIRRYNRDEQRAFWINLYNAATVKLVLDHYPVASIREIKPGKQPLFGGGPWQHQWLKVEKHRLSLDDIEHRILRPIWQDPLLHYSLNCASVGCPSLPAQAYTAKNYLVLAEAGAQRYVNSTRGAHFRDGRLSVSSLYSWYKDDFGGRDWHVLQHLRRYADQDLKQKLAGLKQIRADHYDWSLNDVKVR